MRHSLLPAAGAFSVLLILASLLSCAQIQVASIPSPSQTARLRIFVYPLSGELQKGAWGKSHEEFAEGQIKRAEKMLERTGIYDVVNNADVQSAIGTSQPTRWQLQSNDWALTRRIANAVHADYALIVERGLVGRGNFFWENVLINTTTGKEFGVYLSFWGNIPENTPKKAYQELFKDAKEDLLATAVKKSRAPSRDRGAASPEEAGQKSAPAHGPENFATLQKPEQKPTQKPVVPAGTALTASRVIDTRTISFDDEPAGKGERLIVYDLEATENLKITALIISECLREEIYKLGRFTMVNRENMLKVMEEMKFQQTGLVDEKQAVQLGKGMAADHIITGRLGALGGLSILQAKLIHVQSFGTSAIASLKCKQGEEEALLDQLNQLVKKLVQ
ncbi:MAG: penicillin-binding protein activator LpoB [Proteobacteria bacterium]|nr:penicillin-binding protein activator LpoB [Pseudomonadota bacterium]